MFNNEGAVLEADVDEGNGTGSPVSHNTMPENDVYERVRRVEVDDAALEPTADDHVIAGVQTGFVCQSKAGFRDLARVGSAALGSVN